MSSVGNAPQRQQDETSHVDTLPSTPHLTPALVPGSRERKPNPPVLPVVYAAINSFRLVWSGLV